MTSIIANTLSRNKSSSSIRSSGSKRTVTKSFSQQSLNNRSESGKSVSGKSISTESSKSVTSKASSKITVSLSSLSNDKYIKLILKHFKKLELGLNKFNAKHHDIYTTNILRTVVLPFLRINYLNRIKDINAKTYKSLVSIFLSLILKWWSSLLHNLINSNSLSNIDRSVYLECISRIISRLEWFNTDMMESNYHDNYRELLILTLEFSINKLSTIKHLSLSIAAFIGKVFAYSFFQIPNVSNALLFLLNIKQKIFEENFKIFKHYSPLNQSDIDNLYNVFPKHLHYLINYQGLKNLKGSHQKSLINCLLPPSHPVQGIKDPSGSWVSRWLNSDSDIFNSFLRHYFEIVDNLFMARTTKEFHYLDNNSNPIILNLPGFNIILSHIYQITKVSITRIAANNSKIKYPEFNVNFHNNNSDGLSNSEKQNQIYYNSIFKIFRTFRDIDYSNSVIGKKLINFLDLIIMDFAEKTSIYDFNKNSLMLNIMSEFLNYFEVVRWEFWLQSIYLMIENTDHVQIILKNLSFLFNIWNYIPEILPEFNQNGDLEKLPWYKDGKLSFKENFINWLISPTIWQKLFINYNSIIRSYYIKLLAWRLVGINNFESSNSIKISLNIEYNLKQCYEVFGKFYETNEFKKIYYRPDNPLINKKFTILPISNGNDNTVVNIEDFKPDDDEISLINSTTIKKTHPYEIFDEAIYSCNSLSDVKVESNDEKRSNSLVNSIGKIFKILTTDDKDEKQRKNDKEFGNNANNNGMFGKLQAPKSVSFTSLSATSLTSRSSSPSLLSFSSTPTSLTDLSESSKSSLEEEEVKESELFKLPPEIIRPMYKFDLINDQDSIRDKFLLMNNKHYLCKDQDFYRVPESPRIPTISIFINSDIYNKIYISTENLFMNNTTQQINNHQLLDPSRLKAIDFVNLGKSIYEWNLMVDEFENFLISKVENDKFNDLSNLNEADYFKKLIPLLSIDNSKSLNAA